MMGWTLPCISLDNKKLGIQWALTICTENSGKNSNGTVHPGGNFPKKVIPFEVLPFSGFYQNDGNYLYHFSGWPVICFLLRQEVISLKPGPLVIWCFCKWYHSNPFLFSERFRSSVPFVRIFAEICFQMLSAQFFAQYPPTSILNWFNFNILIERV